MFNIEKMQEMFSNPYGNGIKKYIFEILKEIDEKLGWVDELPDEELERELNGISERLTRLLEKLQLKVEQQDKLKLEKWNNSNK